MTLRQLTGHNLEFLSLKGGCTSSSESTHAKCHIVGNHMSRDGSILVQRIMDYVQRLQSANLQLELELDMTLDLGQD